MKATGLEMLRIIILAAGLCFSTCAHAVYYTYAQWESLPDPLRAAYISGVYDALVSFSSGPSEDAVNAHYSNCVRSSRMNNGQLSEAVRAFARARPEVQKTVPVALGRYLYEFCGAPP